MANINFDTATKAQLLQYAQEELGLSISPSTKRDDILAKISAKLGVGQGEDKGVTGKVKIILNKMPGESSDVRLSINSDRSITIKRGYEVWVEPAFVALLRTLKKRELSQDPETLEWEERISDTIPFSILENGELVDKFEEEQYKASVARMKAREEAQNKTSVSATP